MKIREVKLKLADPIIDDYDVYLTEGSFGEMSDAVIDHNTREVHFL